MNRRAFSSFRTRQILLKKLGREVVQTSTGPNTNGWNPSMSNRELPSPEMLRQLLRYEPKTGLLFWLPRPLELFPDERAMKSWNTHFADARAFLFQENHGYMSGKVFRKTYRAHRVVWAIVNGKWPEGHIDHINGNRADNRIENLRDVTRISNQRNQKLSCKNTSGYAGVRHYPKRNKWSARIRINNRQDIYLGMFSSKDEAIAARKKAEADHGYHENHGKR
jgi:hypothetical protein